MYLNDTHREKHPSKTQELTKSMNIDIWVIGKFYQLFYTQMKFSTKKKTIIIISGKTPFFVIGPFYTSHSICLNIGFDRAVLIENVALSIEVHAFLKNNAFFLSHCVP